MTQGAGSRARYRIVVATVVPALLLCVCASPRPASAQTATDDSVVTAAKRPFVPGGTDDKPMFKGLYGRIQLGGYLEGSAGWERADGVIEELGIELTRWNILLSTTLRDRVTIFSEIEFEDGGDEITIEIAQADVHFAPPVNLRAGVLLLPLGRFNLTHDAPRNELTTRPAEAEQLLGVALSQPGLGGFGRFDREGGSRFTYEAYAVTGYHDEIITDSPDGTRLPEGRRNFEDANASLAAVGRFEWSPSQKRAFGISGFHGAYNQYRVDGLQVDERRDVSVVVFDLATPTGPLTWNGEVAFVNVEIPAGLVGLFAERQAGAYLSAAWPFGAGWIDSMPQSWFTVAARGDWVDFDRDLEGDSLHGLVLGLNFRPVPETVLKLDYERSRTRDRFNNLADSAGIRLGLASYF